MSATGNFLRNCWYVAAWDYEVPRLEMLRRLLLNKPVVLYRRTDGTPVALEDRCCHRHAPLSSGKLQGDNVVCGYHGFVFDPNGRCIHIPSQDAVPPDARVKSYPVVERYHWIWIWMGDPALADDSLIEDFHWMDDPAWRSKGERMSVEGNYMLLVENLCDLTHLSFVHAASLAGMAIPQNEIPVKYDHDGDRVRVERWMRDAPVPPYFRAVVGLDMDMRIDRWLHLEFSPPGMIRLDIGAAPAGTGATEGDRRHAVTTRNLNAITPETERSTHYFWAQARDFAIDDASVTELEFKLVHGAFLEDLAMIGAQQRNIDLDPSPPRIDVAADAGGIHARRIVERLIEDERSAARAAE